MNIVFMGTPEIAKTSLFALLTAGQTVTGVFTREDKPVGRKQIITPSPVKVLALENDIPVAQPKTLKNNQEMLDVLKEMNPDLIVVVAYGLILPTEVLELPKYGAINLHVSMLPKYRGAAPIQWAVINGDAQTGVTVMQMDEGLDTGPIIEQRTVTIGEMQTAGEVFEVVAKIGADLLCETVQLIEEGKDTITPQQGQATLAPPLNKKMAEIDFSATAKQVHNLVRGCNPWPMAWFLYEGKKIKVANVKPTNQTGKTGEILQTNPLVIACGEGAVLIEHVVPEGSKPMTGTQWAAGKRFTAGENICR